MKKIFHYIFKREIPRELLGAKKEPFMKEDFKLAEIMKEIQPFDWNKGYDIEEDLGLKIPIKTQGSSSSCVAQAWAYYAGILDAFEIKTYREQSARWIYSQIYHPDGGAFIRDGGQILINQGIVPSALFPDKLTEEEMRIKDDATKDLKNIAKVYLKDSYVSIEEFYTIDTFAEILKERKGFVGGVFDGFDSSWRSAFPKPSGNTNMGHCLYFGKAKLINGKKYLGVCNSWGDQIGDKGWQWLGIEWFNSGRILFPKTILDLPDEIERPPEKPHYQFNKDLKWGMTDPDVKMLQRCLAYEGCFLYQSFTDFFGGYTLRAVKTFQQKYGIEPVSGIVGPLTRAKLNQIFGS